MSTSERRRRGRYVTVAAALALVGGATLVGAGIAGHPGPAAPPDSSRIPVPATSAPTVRSSTATPTAPAPAATAPVRILSRSIPTRIAIPAIGVDSSVMQLGLNPDGTLQVPPYDKNAPAGWYRGSPTPGELGPSVILGHVDTFKAGPVVFYRLAQLHPGNQVIIHRQDGRTATFVVDRVENIPKDNFPTLKVYGNTDRPELRIVTCGGEYNQAKHDYTDNTVVFAHLQSRT
jgi:LPXTG-site transpeptidase (sortase) family protein